MQQYSEDREAYRRWPRPTPRIPALRRRAPTVRFITFETLVTGVRAFECAFSVRTSSFVHGLMTRRAVVAFTVLADFVVLTAFFKALGIIQVLHLNAAQIGTRCGDKKTDALTYSILSDNWYVIVLPPVEEEIRRAIRNERAKDAAHRSVCSWGRGRPGRGVTPSPPPAKRRPASAMRRKLRCMSGEACQRPTGIDVNAAVPDRGLGRLYGRIAVIDRRSGSGWRSALWRTVGFVKSTIRLIS